MRFMPSEIIKHRPHNVSEVHGCTYYLVFCFDLKIHRYT